MAYRRDWIQPQVGPMGFANTSKVIGRVINVVAGDNVAAATIGAFKLPAGFTVTGLLGSATDMDTAGPTMLISVGDAASSARYVASVSSGAPITSWTLAAPGFLFLNTTDTEIIVTVIAAATTFAAGTITLYFTGFMAQ